MRDPATRDTPAGPSPTPEQVRRELDRLRQTRTSLLEREALSLTGTLGEAGARFLDPEDPLTREALDRVAEEAGYSSAMARRVVAGMARDWTRDRLTGLLFREFGDPEVLDRFTAPGPLTAPDGSTSRDRSSAPHGSSAPGRSSAEDGWERRVRAMGDGVAVHIGSGSVPGVSATSLVRSLLVKTPVLVKPGGGDRALTRLLHQAVAEVDPALAESVAVAYWPGGSREVERAALEGADRVVVYGSDLTAASIREATPVTTPVVVYHHRISVAVVGPGALEAERVDATARALAWAGCTFDQRGCVSPHRVLVLGSLQDTRDLGAAVARAMRTETEAAPPGDPDPREQAALQQLRGEVELRAAAGEDVAIWKDAGTGWTVVVDPEPPRGLSGTVRTLTLIPVASSAEMGRVLAPLASHLQSAGTAGLGPREAEVAEILARAGVTRMAPLEDLPFPPAWWLHDGKGPLRALVHWAEWTR